MLDSSKLWEALSKRRKELRMTWIGVARESGVPESTIYHLKTGRSSPTMKTVLSLARWGGLDIVDFISVPPPKVPRERPPRLLGMTHKTVTHHGNLYVTVTRHDGRPFDTFVSIGSSGPCERAAAESIGRLVSYGLRIGGDVQDIIRQLEDITCEPTWYQGEQIKSIADGVAKMLKQHMEIWD